MKKPTTEGTMADRDRTSSGPRPDLTPGERAFVWLAQVAENEVLTEFTLRVAIVLAWRVKGGTAAISLPALAKFCRATKTGVANAVQALKRHGHLTIVTPGKPGAR